MDSDYTEYVNKIKVKDCIKITVSAEFLEANFEMIKQCLRKMGSLKGEIDKMNKTMSTEVYERLNYIQKEVSDHKNHLEEVDGRVATIEKKQFLDPILKTIHDLQVKTDLSLKNRQSQGFQNMVKRLEALDKFVTSTVFKQYKSETESTLSDVGRLRGELDRYVDNTSFKNFKDETETGLALTNQVMEQVSGATKELSGRVDKVDEKTNLTAKELKQNSGMLKEINFVEIQARMRKFREESQLQINEMKKKMKRIISTVELGNLEKAMVEKMDEYLMGMNRKAADRDQTKRALMFLENRINVLINAHSAVTKDESDPLFATRQWMCAACSKDLGKYQGKLGKYKPWSVFPCRQLSPEKSGGYGYLSYIDKVSYRKGISYDDSNLQRLNQTGHSFRRLLDATKQKQHSPEPNTTSREKKLNSTATSFMNAFGENVEEYPRLKGEYFRNPEDREKESSKQDSQTEGRQTEREENNAGTAEDRKGMMSVRKTQRTFRVKDGKRLDNVTTELKKESVKEELQAPQAPQV